MARIDKYQYYSSERDIYHIYISRELEGVGPKG